MAATAVVVVTVFVNETLTEAVNQLNRISGWHKKPRTYRAMFQSLFQYHGASGAYSVGNA